MIFLMFFIESILHLLIIVLLYYFLLVYDVAKTYSHWVFKKINQFFAGITNKYIIYIIYKYIYIYNL